MKVLLAAILFALPMSASAVEYRPLNFKGMDTDMSGAIDRNEWRLWYLEDTRRRSFGQAPAIAGPTIQTSEGAVTLTPRAAPVGGVDSTGAFETQQQIRALRDEGFARGAEGLSPMDRRDRLRQFGGSTFEYIPTFEEFDLNADGQVTQEELTSATARPWTRRQGQ